MGMLLIRTYGSFSDKQFETCAESGGHVCAIKRGIQYLTEMLGPAVVQDAKLAKEGCDPPKSPLGQD